MGRGEAPVPAAAAAGAADCPPGGATPLAEPRIAPPAAGHRETPR